MFFDFFKNYYKNFLSPKIKNNLISKNITSKEFESILINNIKSKNKKKKCVLVIGHDEKSQGAINIKHSMSEFIFNEKLAYCIKFQIEDTVDIEIVYRTSYNTLPFDINSLNSDFIISLHCNAFNKTASGTETLYYHSSKKGKEIANIMNKEIVKCLVLRNRGIQEKTSEDRGGYLLINTKSPCIIVEPFFIDNDNDFEVAESRKKELVIAYVIAIQKIAKII